MHTLQQSVVAEVQDRVSQVKLDRRASKMYNHRFQKRMKLQSTRIANEGAYGALEVFGPTLEFLTLPEEGDPGYCVMMGTIPPSVSVRLCTAILIRRVFS
jgi:hypothetical protein